MGSRKATLMFILSLVLLIGGCSGEEPASQAEEEDFQEGTLSSNQAAETTGGLAESTGDSAQRITLRVEGGEETRFSGICTVGGQEYIISGSPSKSYSFENRPFSCAIEKQDPGGGSLKVTVVAGDSTRSVQQTSAEGGTIDVSYGAS